LKAQRIEIEKQGLAMRGLLTPVTKMISAREKELIDIITPEEERLSSREKWFEGELDRIKKEKEQAEFNRIQARINDLANYGVAYDFSKIKSLSDKEFEMVLNSAKEDHKAEAEKKIEADRVAAEEKRLEDERIAKERAELEVLRKEKEERDAELKKAQDELAAARKKEEDRIRAEKEAEEAKAKAIREEEKRLAELALIEKQRDEAITKALADAKEANEKSKAKEAKRLAKLPDIEKAEIYLSSCMSTLPIQPQIKDEEVSKIVDTFVSSFGDLATKAIKSVADLKR
jgi:chromosome segregation ATPase